MKTHRWGFALHCLFCGLLIGLAGMLFWWAIGVAR